MQQATDIPWLDLKALPQLGVTAGASAQELLVNEIIDAFRARFDVTVESVVTTEERILQRAGEFREAGGS